jgi:hypothetical protein
VANTDTNWTKNITKLMLTSGSFTTTVKSSVNVSTNENIVQDMEWDGTDCLYCGNAGRLLLQSGQHTSTLKTSLDVTAVDTTPSGISDLKSGDTPWAGLQADKFYTTSGRFSSTLKTSLAYSAGWPVVFGMTTDDTNTWCTPSNNEKIAHLSGQFTTTVKTSLTVSALTTRPHGVSIRLGDTYLATRTGGLGAIYFLSGQFSSTVKDSLKSLGDARGIATQDYANRLGLDAIAPVLVSSISKRKIMPYASGKIVHGKLPSADHSAVTVIVWQDINGNTYTPAIGDRFILTDVHITNATGANTCTLFQDLDAGNDNDAGEPIVTAEFAGQGTWSQSFTLPHATEKLVAAANDLHFVSSAVGETTVLIHAFITKT